MVAPEEMMVAGFVQVPVIATCLAASPPNAGYITGLKRLDLRPFPFELNIGEKFLELVDSKRVVSLMD